jgi:hypothetical protein
MDPVALLARLRPHVPHGDPEAEGAIAHGNDGRAHTPPLQVAEHCLPTLRALAVAVLDGDQLLRPVGPHADHDQRAEPVVLQADVEVHAVDADVHVVAVGEAPLLEIPVLVLPLVGQPRDVRGGQTGRVLSEERHEGLPEIAGGQPPQVEHGQHLGDLRGATHVRREDAARELAPVAIGVDPTIVHPRGIHGDRP